MKKFIQKTVAGVSALAMTAALSATAVPAFADEYEAVQAQNFVDSFENPETREVAQYCLDSGLNFEELKDMMTRYEHGLELIAEREVMPYAIDTGKTFYSATQLAQTQHYLVVFANNGSASGYATMYVKMDNTWVDYDTTNLPYTLINENADIRLKKMTDGRIRISGDIPATNTVNNPCCVLRMPFGVIGKATASSAYTESTLYHKFSIERTGYESENGKDTTYSLETYALGDVDHSGYVDDADSTYALQFLTQQIKYLSFTYTDKSSNIAGPLNFFALDANEDGKIDITDAVKINTWAANK